MEKLPLYRVTTSENTFEFRGILDCRQIGSLIFTDRDGVILKIMASGFWLEATKIQETPESCPVCGKDR